MASIKLTRVEFHGLHRQICRAGLLALLACGLPLFGACAPAKAFADWERGANFQPGGTFAILRSPELPENLTEHQQALVQLTEAAIGRELSAKGYRAAPPEAAQLIVSFHVLKGQRKQIETKQTYCVASNLSGYATTAPVQSYDLMLSCEESLVSNYDSGTLIIDVFDAAKQLLIWHGWSSAELPPPGASETAGLVERATVNILENFPPS